MRTCRRCLAALAVAALLLAPVRHARAAGPEKLPTPPPPTRPVCIRGTCFDAEVALTDEERARGLMYRESLPKDRGMLFVFPREAFYRFWMKNTKIELDIIFIGADKRIVSISKRAKPCTKDPCERYAPDGNALYVLEINGGLADASKFAAGDPVDFRQAPPATP
jgi:uncharacterized membrane protein (UPF0127 family)